MKRKILTLSILLSVIAISSFINAGELSFEPSYGKYSPGCMLGIDIVMDPGSQQISATDIVIESSMQFIKFEPTTLFPYFLPSKITNNTVHIIGFTAGPSQRINQKGVIGKIYFKPQNKSDVDGSIKLYFKNKGDTTDTNLSIGGGIDVLEDVGNGFYTFDGSSCNYPEEVNIEEKVGTLEEEIAKVEKDHRSQLLQRSREDNKSYIISLFIIILIIVLVAYFKTTLTTYSKTILATYSKISKGKSKKK